MPDGLKKSSLKKGFFMNRMRLLYLCMCLPLLLVVTGCHRYATWATQTFTGGSRYEGQVPEAYPFLCSRTIYDQFQTIASFDALWLSLDVRNLFVDLWSVRRHLTDAERLNVATQQAHDFGHAISFYLLTPRSAENSVATESSPLGKWAVSLAVDGVRYQPREVKMMDLSPEYKKIFGTSAIRFKQAYLIHFNVRDAQEKEIITPDTKKIELIISSESYYTTCGWEQSSTGWHTVAN